MKQEKVKNVYKDFFNDKKTIISLLSMSLCFILVIFLSFGSSLFFRELDSSFWSDTAISIALCVYCLYFGIPQGVDLYKKKENGKYKFNLKAFEAERSVSIKRDAEFNQWLEAFYQKNKNDYFVSLLSLNGFRNMQVLDLDLSEIDNLLKPYKKCWDETEFAGRKDTYFRTHTKKQIDILREILVGKINVARIPDDYFKTFNGKMLVSEYIAQQRQEKQNQITYAMLIIGRVIFVVIFALVFSLFGVSLMEDPTGSQIFQSFWTMLTRLWTMLSSFYYGLEVGKIMVQRDADKLDFKARVNRMFNEDKDFKPVSEEELAKREYDLYEKTHPQVESELVDEALNNAENNDTILLGYKGG